jgi:hypothetical protein
MKDDGRGCLSITRLLFAAAGAIALPTHAALVCDDPTGNGLLSSPPERPNDVDFVRAELASSQRLASSDRVSLELVSLNRDVLHRAGEATRLAVTLSGEPALTVRSVICVRSRTGMLGLDLQNNGTSTAGGLARVHVSTSGNTAVLYTRLPRIEAGKSRHVLLSSGVPLAGASAISLHLLSKGG